MLRREAGVVDGATGCGPLAAVRAAADAAAPPEGLLPAGLDVVGAYASCTGSTPLADQLTALLRTRRQRVQARPFRRCVLHSRVGGDLYGELVAKQIRKAGVTLSARREGAQGVCICLSGEADRAFVSYKGSVADFTESDIDMSALLTPGTAHLHFSAYYDCAGLQPAVPKLVQAAKRQRGATVSVVPQSDATGEYGELRRTQETVAAREACRRVAAPAGY